MNNPNDVIRRWNVQTNQDIPLIDDETSTRLLNELQGAFDGLEFMDVAMLHIARTLGIDESPFIDWAEWKTTPAARGIVV